MKHVDYVEYVEEETYATVSQSCPLSWGLDRIDQISSTLDCIYNPGDHDGEGTDIYILDTGTVPVIST